MMLPGKKARAAHRIDKIAGLRQGGPFDSRRAGQIDSLGDVTTLADPKR
jgi:hypothetical protein